MARKFTAGLGSVSTDAAVTDGKSVSLFSGSQIPGTESVGVLVASSDQLLDPTKIVKSAGSAIAYHSTLFEDFSLTAVGYYNFFEDDELTNPTQDQSAHINDIARYIELSWRGVPVRQVILPSRKGQRPPDERQAGIKPVLSAEAANSSVANGYVSPGTVRALLVNPVIAKQISKFDEDAFLTDPTGGGRNAATYRQEDTSPFHFDPLPSKTERVRANFVDPSIAGALAPTRIGVSSEQVHLATLGSFGKLAPGLEVLSEFNQDVPQRNPPPKFPASTDAPTLMYVGYIIERYSLGADGEMNFNKSISLDDPWQRKYIDRDVLFAERYAYRIRTIVQWTHPSDVGFGGKSTLSRNTIFDAAAGTQTSEASFYSGDWSDWSNVEIVDDLLPEPPDELTIRPISSRGIIDVVWKMPNDPQRDLASVRLLRAEMVGGRLGPWKQLGEFAATNGRFVDHAVAPYEESSTAYVYSMYSVSVHGELSALSEQIEARMSDKSHRIGEEPLRQVAIRGGDPFGSSSSKRQMQRDWTVIAKQTANFYIRSADSSHPLFDRNYVVEIQSLSTGERVQVTLAVDSTDIHVSPSGGSRRA